MNYNASIFFYRLTADRGLGFNTLFLQYYSAICRPSVHTVGRPGPGPRSEPGMGDLEADTLTTRPPHLLWLTCRTKNRGQSETKNVTIFLVIPGLEDVLYGLLRNNLINFLAVLFTYCNHYSFLYNLLFFCSSIPFCLHT